MSKIETVRALNDSLPNLEIVRAVASLQQVVSPLNEAALDMSKMLHSLPLELGEQMEQSLRPLRTVDQQITKILSAFDKVNEAQRATLEELMAGIAAKSKQDLDQILKNNAQALSSVAQQVNVLKSSIQEMTSTAKTLGTLPAHVQKAQIGMANEAEALTKAAAQLSSAAAKVKAPWWKTGLILLAVALGGGLSAAVAVSIASAKLVPPNGVSLSEEQQEQIKRGNAFNLAWNAADEQTKQRLQQAYNQASQ